MTDEAARIERGHQAGAVLNNPIFVECLAGLEQKYIEAWKAAQTVELREDAHRYVMLLEWFRQDIGSVFMTGELTQQRIEQLTQFGGERMHG